MRLQEHKHKPLLITHFKETGNLREIIYREQDNKNLIEKITFYENGQLKSKVKYKKFKKNGECFFYDENGNETIKYFIVGKEYTKKEFLFKAIYPILKQGLEKIGLVKKVNKKIV